MFCPLAKYLLFTNVPPPAIEAGLVVQFSLNALAKPFVITCAWVFPVAPILNKLYKPLYPSTVPTYRTMR